MADPVSTVLVVEPSEIARGRWRAVLRSEGREVHAAANADEALARLSGMTVQVVVLSLDLPEAPGNRALAVFSQRIPGVPIIATTELPTPQGAVEALRHGAVDYLGQADNRARWMEAVSRAEKEAQGRRALEQARGDVADRYGLSHMVSQSPRMLEVFDSIRKVAQTDATVLILGETGTGKELVSKAIHERSRRAKQAFIAVNCGAFAESLLESELFGHEKGSFTGAAGRREGLFEMADGGTLFLDELGETSLNVQVNLLRVLEEMEFRRVGGRDPIRVDVRIVAATNVHLDKAVQDGSFRLDLYYRLNVFPIRLPPLRERVEDIPLLMRVFLDEIAQEYQMDSPIVSREAIEAILSYHWPGNVRQLRALCERWVITRGGARLEPEHLGLDLVGQKPPEPTFGEIPVDDSVPMKMNVDRVTERIERAYLVRMLQRNKGHLERTAELSGITRRTLYTKMKDFGLKAEDFKG